MPRVFGFSLNAMDAWRCPVCGTRCKIDFPLNNLTTCPTHGKMTVDMLADLQMVETAGALRAIVEWQRIRVDEIERWEARVKAAGFEGGSK